MNPKNRQAMSQQLQGMPQPQIHALFNLQSNSILKHFLIFLVIKIRMRVYQSRLSQPNNPRKAPNVPLSRITIRVDQLINNSYSRLVTGKLKCIIDSDVPASNQLLVDYIHQIYQSYNIRRPEDTFNAQIQHHQRVSVGAQQQFADINSQPTKRRMKPKSQVAQRSSNHIPNSQELDKDMNTSRIQVLSRSKQKIMKLKQKGTQDYINQSLLSKSALGGPQRRKTSASIRRRIMINSPQTVKINLHDSVHVHHFSSSGDHRVDSTFPRQSNQSTRVADTEVKPVFRYCMACEEPILEINIRAHEVMCAGLRKLYTLSFEDILKHILRKIIRLRKQMTQLVNHQEPRCNNVKAQVKKWLTTIDQCALGKLNPEFHQKYQRIQKAFYCESVKLVEQSQKLRWFLRVRQQLKSRFHV